MTLYSFSGIFTAQDMSVNMTTNSNCQTAMPDLILLPAQVDIEK